MDGSRQHESGRQGLHEWRVLGRRRLFEAQPWLEVWAEDVRLPSGRVIESFYKLEMPDYAVVVPLVADGVLAQRQYKHGAGSVGIHLPSGYLERGEEPLDAARRELIEETGYEADTWTFLGTFVNDGNRGAGKGHFFLARGARRVRPPNDDELEESKLVVMTLDALVAAVRNGDVSLLSVAAAIGLAGVNLTSKASCQR